MFTFILVTLFLLPVASLPLGLTFFSSNELDEMGVCLENMDGLSYEEQALRSESLLMNMAVACGNS